MTVIDPDKHTSSDVNKFCNKLNTVGNKCKELSSLYSKFSLMFWSHHGQKRLIKIKILSRCKAMQLWLVAVQNSAIAYFHGQSGWLWCHYISPGQKTCFVLPSDLLKVVTSKCCTTCIAFYTLNMWRTFQCSFSFLKVFLLPLLTIPWYFFCNYISVILNGLLWYTLKRLTLLLMHLKVIISNDELRVMSLEKP